MASKTEYRTNSSLNESENDYDIMDVEGYRGNKDQQFSHQALVMRSMSKCIELASKEMHAGYFDERSDNKGNVTHVYREDSREAFIESVKTIEMVMACDMDPVAVEEIGKIKEEINKIKDVYLNAEREYWENMKPNVRNSMIGRGYAYQTGLFNKDFRFFHEYKKIEVDLYREIFKELSKLSFRLGFYEEEALHAIDSGDRVDKNGQIN